MDKEVKQIEFEAGNNDSRKYKIEAIWDSAIYARESESSHLPGLYYLVSWIRYLKEKNTWEPTSAVQHLRKLISSFHNNHPDKPTTTSSIVDSALPIARLTIKPTECSKQKWGQQANSTNKWAKTNWAAFEFYHVFGWIWVTPTLDFLSCNVHDCTWLYMTSSQPSSNFLQSLDFLSFLSLGHKALVFLLKLPLGQKVFHWWPSINISFSSIINWFLSGFHPQSPVIRLGGFSPAIWLFKTHQLSYGARIFSLVSRFFSIVPQ